MNGYIAMSPLCFKVYIQVTHIKPSYIYAGYLPIYWYLGNQKKCRFSVSNLYLNFSHKSNKYETRAEELRGSSI